MQKLGFKSDSNNAVNGKFVSHPVSVSPVWAKRKWEDLGGLFEEPAERHEIHHQPHLSHAVEIN